MELKTTEKLEHSIVKLVVAVSAEELNKGRDAAYKKEKNQIQIQGFRRGKAPRKVVEKMYGDIFLEEAINIVSNEKFPKAIEEAGITPVGMADLQLENISDDGCDIVYLVPVEPEDVTVGEYKGIEIDAVDDEITEEEVQAELDRLAQRAASTETVERAAELGDVVVLDFEGFVDGAAFEGGKGTDYSLKLGSGTFIPGFEDQLVGKSAGDECDVNVTFPETYPAEDLKGKPAVFKCAVKLVMQTVLPEMDDEFAKDVSEFETLAELKKDIEEKGAESKKASAEQAKEEQIMDKLVAGMEADIPQSMFDSKLDSIMNDYSYRLLQQGMKMEDYVKQMGMEMNSFREIFRPQAERQVKVELAVKKIAALEGIAPTDEEVAAEYKRLAEAYGIEEDQVKQFVPVESIKSDLTGAKTLQMIKDSAVIVAKAAE